MQPQDQTNDQTVQFQQKSQQLPSNQQPLTQNPPLSYATNAQQPFTQNPQPSYPPNAQQPFTQNPQPSYPANAQRPPMQNFQQPYPQTNQRFQYNFSEKQMRRYFSKPARIWIWLVWLGVFAFLFGIIVGGTVGAATGGIGAALGVPFIIFGIMFFIVGGIPILLHYARRPSEDQYSKWVFERSQPLYYTAIQRLHIDLESQRPTVVEVEGGISSLVRLAKKFPEKEIILKRLSSGLRHYSINTAMYIFLTKNEIAIYSGYINALAQKERFEDAVRYYYQDIVAVSTSGPIFLYSDGTSTKEIQMQGFLVSANNGDVVGTDYAVNVILRDGERKEVLQGVDKVVPALLHFLKDHKVSAIQAHITSNDLL